MTNKEVERRAIDIAIDFEMSQNRKPKDISQYRSGKGYDIASGRRKIEVKGFSGDLPSAVVLNYYNYKAYKKNKNFWLYLVYNFKRKKPQIKILKRAEIESRGEEYTQLEIKLRKKTLKILELK